MSGATTERSALDYDVVVVGAGLAGLVAAASAAESGLRVGIVARSSGSLGLWSGLVSGRIPPTEAGARAVRFFMGYSAAAGLPMAEVPGTLRLVSATGRPVTSALTPRTAAADLAPGSKVLVVGFSELADYPAALIAETASRLAGLDCHYRSLSLGSAAGRGLAPRIARLFDDEEWFDGFLTSARRFLAADASSASTVLLPPVTGLDHFGRNVARLEDSLGTAVRELPALPPSVPGHRFSRLWRHRLESTGRVSVHIGRTVTGSRVENDRCRWVSDGLVRYEATSFVLATGGVAGGGIVVGPDAFFGLSRSVGDHAGLVTKPVEPVLGLETRGEGAAWLTWGVRTDYDGHPYRAGEGGGARRLENVYVAGWEAGVSGATGPQAASTLLDAYRAGSLAARDACLARERWET
ncbi:MAG: FAD-binding protein [Bacillota bacterium]|nr:MAG: FAD-binding protein [Bacillota bacterium]